jgi:HD-like signal output (HDOD) protein
MSYFPLSAVDLAREIDVFPPMMPSLLRLTELISSEDYTMDQVEKLVQFDQTLTVESLRLANAADAVGQKRISTVHDAVLRLGGERISKYLFSKWLKGSVKIPLRSYGIDPAGFWAHGAVIAIAADLLDKEQGSANPGVYFTAGLLHDLGKIILDHFAVRIGCEVDWKSLPSDADLLQVEHEFFGRTHEDIVVSLMTQWNFPEQVIQAMEGFTVANASQRLYRDSHHLEAWIQDPSIPLQVSPAMAERVQKEYATVRTMMGM